MWMSQKEEIHTNKNTEPVMTKIVHVAETVLIENC